MLKFYLSISICICNYTAFFKLIRRFPIKSLSSFYLSLYTLPLINESHPSSDILGSTLSAPFIAVLVVYNFSLSFNVFGTPCLYVNYLPGGK